MFLIDIEDVYESLTILFIIISDMGTWFYIPATAFIMYLFGIINHCYPLVMDL